MPLGVEHSYAASPPGPPRVILALMPLGVEHVSGAYHGSDVDGVILALMPLGVEHDSPSWNGLAL